MAQNRKKLTLKGRFDYERPVKKSHRNRVKGNIGEEVACKYMRKRGFEIIERNYRKPWGELDIIAVKGKVIHFVEVKSVTVSRLPRLYGDSRIAGHSPIDNVNAFKLKQIRKMVRTYFGERRLNTDREFAFHVLCVYLDMQARKARVQWIRDIIL